MEWTPQTILKHEDLINRELCNRNLSEYAKQAWHVVEPATPYLHNWHIDAISDHLTAVLNGQIKRLLINIPPRHEKSLLTAVFFPTWVWGPQKKPFIRFLFSSYAESLSIRDSIKCRNIINSAWYQKNWGNVFKLAGDQNEKRRYENDKTGYRLATSVSGSNTGEGGKIIVIDDPHNVVDGESDAVREATLLWFKEVIPSRLNDPKTDAIIVIMQRVHDGDVAGECAKQGNYVHLCLPCEYEPREMLVNPLNFKDPRTKEGELLWPERFGVQEINDLKTSLGSYAYAGQYQQRPVPRGGGVIKASWLKFWEPQDKNFGPAIIRLKSGEVLECPVVKLPEKLQLKIQSWDLSFDDTANSAFVVGEEWGQYVEKRFLLDQVREQMDFPKTIKSIRMLKEKYPDTSVIYIEKKANGAAAIKTLCDEIPGILPVEPEGDKVARMAAISYLWDNGNVYLPHPAIAPWVETEYIPEILSFPKSSYKDQADTTSQALSKMRYDYPAPKKTEHDEVVEKFGIGSAEARIYELLNGTGTRKKRNPLDVM